MLAVILALVRARVRLDPPRVAQRLVPEEPRVGGVVLLYTREERGVGRMARRVTVAVD